MKFLDNAGYEEQPSRGPERRKLMWNNNDTLAINDTQTKKDCNRGFAFERLAEQQKALYYLKSKLHITNTHTIIDLSEC